MTNAATRIAADYTATSQSIDALIERLQAARQAHAQRAAAQPSNWGFLGDAKHLEQQLQELVAGLGA